MGVIGREKEIKIFKEILSSKKAEFLAIYGRRRVGKTFIVKNFFKSQNCILLSLTGIQKGTFTEQISQSTLQISDVFYNGVALDVPKSWFALFELLTKTMGTITKRKKIVIFFDELPWMITPKSRLLEALEYYWNQHWSNDPRIKMIVCGSAASWIIRNIVNNTGGLYGRVTSRMKLEPLNLRETKKFLSDKRITLSNEQILSLYLVMGGIPLYLDQVKRGMSASQIIDEVCFQKNGLLVDELHELFKSLFQKEDTYIEMVREIAKHRYGISKSTLAEILKMPQGGRLTKRLEELEDSGFILSFLPFQHQKRGVYYRVIDEYTMFYFRWIEPNLRSITRFAQAKGYWIEQSQGNSYKAWRGYAFESLCYKHIDQIAKALSLQASDLPYSWRYISKKNVDDESGAQIDILFNRKDGTITMGEMKYTDAPFVLDKPYVAELQNKIAIFRKQTNVDKHIFLVIISVNGVKHNVYSEEYVDGIVTLKDLFH